MNALEKRLERLERLAEASEGPRRIMSVFVREDGSFDPDPADFDDGNTEFQFFTWAWGRADGEPS